MPARDTAATLLLSLPLCRRRSNIDRARTQEVYGVRPKSRDVKKLGAAVQVRLQQPLLIF